MWGIVGRIDPDATRPCLARRLRIHGAIVGRDEDERVSRDIAMAVRAVDPANPALASPGLQALGQRGAHDRGQGADLEKAFDLALGDRTAADDQHRTVAQLKNDWIGPHVPLPRAKPTRRERRSSDGSGAARGP